MKKISMLALASAITLSACAQQKEGDFTIEGTLPDGRRALISWRSVTDDIVASNAALDASFTTYRNNAEARKYDVIFVNGDSNLENLRGKSEGWTVRMTETEFKNRMFE